jgi:hypothetical protein
VRARGGLLVARRHLGERRVGRAHRLLRRLLLGVERADVHQPRVALVLPAAFDGGPEERVGALEEDVRGPGLDDRGCFDDCRGGLRHQGVNLD